MESQRRLLIEELPDTLEARHEFGALCREQGSYEEAETFLTEALEGRSAKLGPDHPDTLESRHELAVLYKQQARYDDAEPLLLEAVKGRLLKLGDKHPHTQESVNNLNELYEVWGKPERIENSELRMSNSEL